MNMDKLTHIKNGVYLIDRSYADEAAKHLDEHHLIIRGNLFLRDHLHKGSTVIKDSSYLVQYNPNMIMDYDYLIELKCILEILIENRKKFTVDCTIQNTEWITKDYIYIMKDNRINIEINQAVN